MTRLSLYVKKNNMGCGALPSLLWLHTLPWSGLNTVSHIMYKWIINSQWLSQATNKLNINQLQKTGSDRKQRDLTSRLLLSCSVNVARYWNIEIVRKKETVVLFVCYLLCLWWQSGDTLTLTLRSGPTWLKVPFTSLNLPFFGHLGTEIAACVGWKPWCKWGK